MSAEIITFLHSGECGDIIAALPTIKLLLGKSGIARLYLDISGGMACNSDQVNKIIGRPMKFNHASFDFIKALIENQDYIESVRIWNQDIPDKINFNLNNFRLLYVTPGAARITKNGNLDFMHKVAFGFKPEYTGPWLKCKTVKKSEVVIGRSTRYQSAHGMLANHIDLLNKAIFIGTQLEYDCFKNAMNGHVENLKYHKCENALDAAVVISGSDLFICNSTFFYWVAVGLGHKNIVHELALGASMGSTYYKDLQNIRYIMGDGFVK